MRDQIEGGPSCEINEAENLGRRVARLDPRHLETFGQVFQRAKAAEESKSCANQAMDMGPRTTAPVPAQAGQMLQPQRSFAPPRTIGWAIKQLHNGSRVTRVGWNGRGQWLALQIPDGMSFMTLPYIYIRTVAGDRVPWLASQTDILATDWQLAYGGGGELVPGAGLGGTHVHIHAIPERTTAPVPAQAGQMLQPQRSFAPPRTIGWAIKQLHNGSRVTRVGWNGRGQWLALQIPDGMSFMTLPYIYIRTVAGDRVPWLASQTDILATDWQLA